MARAYSDDLREEVLGAYALGEGTLRVLAERFEVSYGWVKKIHAAELGTGSRRRVSIAQLARVLKRLGLMLKKSRSTPPSARPKPTGKSAKSSSPF